MTTFIFPTPVGVFPKKPLKKPVLVYLPHTRGGVSGGMPEDLIMPVSSPHPWGCFQDEPRANLQEVIFPTPVGVFLPPEASPAGTTYLPHTRGGVSIEKQDDMTIIKSSPHPWGCFLLSLLIYSAGVIFPTPVGVFLSSPSNCSSRKYLPHTRGGVSGTDHRQSRLRISSPHPWGCFPLTGRSSNEEVIFPTPVGVFPLSRSVWTSTSSLPHTRGGVSCILDDECAEWESSPHPWGCFLKETGDTFASLVFPTPVGVFPPAEIHPQGCICLPHTRGGVSEMPEEPAKIEPSSPHPWGCFSGSRGAGVPAGVFPTPVGVFLPR